MKYHILLNGQARGNIVTKGELLQGDLLSIFIFILCTEAIVTLLNRAKTQGKITCMCVSNASPMVSHIFFHDDILVFCKVEPVNVMK